MKTTAKVIWQKARLIMSYTNVILSISSNYVKKTVVLTQV